MTIYAERRRGKLTGRWVIEVTKDGSRIRRVRQDLMTARAIEARLAAGECVPEAEATTVYTLRWLVSQSARIWDGMRDDQSARRLVIIANLLGLDTDIATIRRPQLTALKDRLVAMPPKSGRTVKTGETINRYLSAISAALRWAHTEEKLTAMPSIPWASVKEFVAVYYTETEERAVVQYLLDHDLERFALIVRVLATTGLRIDELLSLKAGSVREGWIMVGQIDRRTKNGTVGTTPISEALEPRLVALIAEGMPSYRQVLETLRGACVACGIDPKKTPHKLRHTAATRLTSAGVPTATVMSFLRHKSIKTTLKYAHVEDRAVKQAAEVLQTRGALEGQFAEKVARDDLLEPLAQRESGGLARNRTGVQGFAERSAKASLCPENTPDAEDATDT